MKTYLILILQTAFTFTFFNLEGQHEQRQAPICIENFENECDFTWFIYETPSNSQCFQSSEIQGSNVLEGNTSLYISWNLKNCDFWGWGVDLTNGDSSQGHPIMADTLSFIIKLANGNEKFRINLKDTDNNQRGLSSELFIQPHTSSQVVKIPIKRFHRKVNRASLKDINFSFSNSTASTQGNIIIDDLKFEFK